MKRIVFVVLISLLSCSTPKNEIPVAENDTVVASVDTTSVESYEEPLWYTIDEKLLNKWFSVFDKAHSAQSLAHVLYFPDRLIDTNLVDSTNFSSIYTITNVDILKAQFNKIGNTCEYKTIAIATKMKDGAEVYDIFILEPNGDSLPGIGDKITLDANPNQLASDVTVTTEQLGRDSDCFVLKMSWTTQSGSVNLHTESGFFYFILKDESFHPILNIMLEETEVRDYGMSQDENKNSFSEIRDYKIGTTVSNGFFDIKVHKAVKQNGIVTSEGYETYKFDGEVYVVNSAR